MVLDHMCSSMCEYLAYSAWREKAFLLEPPCWLWSQHCRSALNAGGIGFERGYLKLKMAVQAQTWLSVPHFKKIVQQDWASIRDYISV